MTDQISDLDDVNYPDLGEKFFWEIFPRPEGYYLRVVKITTFLGFTWRSRTMAVVPIAENVLDAYKAPYLDRYGNKQYKFHRLLTCEVVQEAVDTIYKKIQREREIAEAEERFLGLH